MMLIPISYLNAYVYCPRRFYLECVRGMYEDNVYTLEGREMHRRVDDPGKQAVPLRKEDHIHRRSVWWSSERLGVTGRLDLLEEDGTGCLYPVEYKKGKAPKGRDPWLNDQIQLCAQALLMAENGLPLPPAGYLYFVGSRKRVEVRITEELCAQTREVIAACRALLDEDRLPPAVDNRNRCFGCSLLPLCLPEEEDVLAGHKTNARRILAQRLDQQSVYVDRLGARVSLSQGMLQVWAPGEERLGEASLEQLQELVLIGPVQVTTQVLHECCRREIPVHYLTLYGRYLGTTAPAFSRHSLLRRAQWQRHFDPERSNEIARDIVMSKLTSARTLAMRYLRDERSEEDVQAFRQIKDLIRRCRDCSDTEGLRGLEGMGTRHYFQCFPRFIKPRLRETFQFQGRVRRPPDNAVNALLSFGYAILAKDCMGAAARVGFDPYCGFYHVMKYGRPALALDIMEYFRQPIVDSAVLGGINNGVFTVRDFMAYQGTCYLSEKGRKKFLAQYEMRKKDHVSHPVFGYRLSYERMIELQLRILGKYLLGDLDKYVGFHIR
jgi:CRISPR-associated endonuclease Cas1/CRISPR-associated protein Cas4